MGGVCLALRGAAEGQRRSRRHGGRGPLGAAFGCSQGRGRAEDPRTPGAATGLSRPSPAGGSLNENEGRLPPQEKESHLQGGCGAALSNVNITGARHCSYRFCRRHRHATFSRKVKTPDRFLRGGRGREEGRGCIQLPEATKTKTNDAIVVSRTTCVRRWARS